MRLHFLLSAVCLGAGLACVSTPQDAELADEGEPLAAEDVPLPSLSLDEIAAEPAEEAPRFDQPWQATLASDLDELEKRTEDFLEASSILYDLLLAADQEGGARASEDAIERAAGESLARYRLVSAASVRLRKDLARPDVKAFLPLAGAEAAAAFVEIDSLLARHEASVGEPRPARYLVRDQRTSVVDFLFAEKSPREVQLASLPRAQREAFGLLDQLRALGTELAFVSNTVTVWLHAPGRDARSLAH